MLRFLVLVLLAGAAHPAVAAGAIGASLWRDRRLARRREERFAEERLGEERLGEHGGRQPAAEPRRPVRT